MSIAGSARSARLAGIHMANIPSSVIVAITPHRTRGLRGVAPYTTCPNNRVDTVPKNRPAHEPQISNAAGLMEIRISRLQ